MSRGYYLHEPLMQMSEGIGTAYAGAKANFYLAGTTTRVDTWTTSDTDPATGTPHANPVIADANGRFPVIYLSPDVEYKIDITDTADVSIPGYPVDDYSNAFEYDQARLGNLLNPRTDAEAAAGINEWTVLNTVGMIVNPQYKAGNIMRYGADPTGAADSYLALAAASDQAYLETSGEGAEVYAPAGLYRSDSKWLFQPPDAKVTISVRGDGKLAGGKLNEQEQVEGTTCFDFTAVTGDNCIELDGTTNQCFAHRFEGFSIFANTTAAGFRAVDCSDTFLSSIGISNLGSGNGFEFDDYFGFRHEFLNAAGTNYRGNGTVTDGSVGYKHEFTDISGGLHHWYKCETNGFDFGYQIGSPFDAARLRYTRNYRIEQCEPHYCRTGYWFRHGLVDLDLETPFLEQNNPDSTGATGRHTDILVTDSAFMSYESVTVSRGFLYGTLTITSGNTSSGENIGGGVEGATITAGAATGTDDEKRFGNIVVDGLVSRLNWDVVIEKLSNTPGDGSIRVKSLLNGRNNYGHGSGAGAPVSNSLFAIPTDEAQHGALFVDNLSDFQRAPFVDGLVYAMDTGTELGTEHISSLPSAALSYEPFTVAANIDFTDSRYLPDTLVTDVATGNTHTILPPTKWETAGGNNLKIYLAHSGGGNTGDVSVSMAQSPIDWSAKDYDIGERCWSPVTGKAYVCTQPGATASEPDHASGVIVKAGNTAEFRWTGDARDTLNGIAGGGPVVLPATPSALNRKLELVQTGKYSWLFLET